MVVVVGLGCFLMRVGSMDGLSLGSSSGFAKMRLWVVW